MRPVEKWKVGHSTPSGVTILSEYSPHTKANLLIQENIDHFCSYCEVFSPDLEVEHIISQHRKPEKRTSWDNFLLACGRCNGKDNKSNKYVDLSKVFFPHLNNTFYIFVYGQGGYVGVNPNLTPDQKTKAEAMLDLVCIDKYPGNPKYPKTNQYPIFGFNANDKRWALRRTAWEDAQIRLTKYLNQELSANDIAEFAYQRGFFSVWYSVFVNHIDVKKALILRFRGTAQNCFDSNYNPISRNPNHPTDPI